MIAPPPRRGRGRRRPLPVADRARASTAACCRRARPRVLTAARVLRAGGLGAAPALAACGALLERMDAVVDALRARGAARSATQAESPADRVRVIPHGAFDYLTRLPDEAPLPAELAAVEGPVVLCFGLIRPYKGVDVLLEAFRAIERRGALGRRTAARDARWTTLREAGGVGARARALRPAVRPRQRAPGLLSPRRPGRRSRTARPSSRACCSRRSRSARRS